MGTFQGRPALIFTAAPTQEYTYITRWLAGHPSAVIACADGGLRHARALGVRPDLVVGDFDSSAEVAAGVECIRLRPEKDDTDAQSCMRALFDRGCSEVTLVCASGGRIDHFLANLSLLEEAGQQGRQAVLLDAQNLVFLHGGGVRRFKIPKEYRYFSIIPLDAVLEGVTITGAKYPLHRATVTRAGVISISNEPAAPETGVEILRGAALIVLSNDKNPSDL